MYCLSGYAHNCSDIVVPACKGIPGYTKTVVSEEVQRRYSDWIKRKINYNPTRDNCSKPRQEIICAENLPACVDSTAAFLCRDNCYKFFNTCTSPFFYGKDMCMEFPKRGDTPKDSVICKQNHWPRTENWKLTEKPTKGKSGLILSHLFVLTFVIKNILYSKCVNKERASASKRFNEQNNSCTTCVINFLFFAVLCKTTT